MALIAMAVHDTEENKRFEYTNRTLESLSKTVDLNKHRLIVIDNNSCDASKFVLSVWKAVSELPFEIITLPENIGTAAAINLAWRKRSPGEHCIKIDNDVEISSIGWINEMEEAIRRDPNIGQVGLKRKDCWESPDTNGFYKSELYMLPHKAGEKWMVGEKVNHVMGTCVMHSSALLDKVGYLYQPKLYGFDDALMSLRSQLAGFKNIFLPHIEIDHIDPGGTEYQSWKEKHASEQWQEYHTIIEEYKSGKRSLYYNPFQTQ